MPFLPYRPFVPGLLAAISLCVPVRSQMVTGVDMPGFAEALDIPGAHPANAFSVTETGFRVAGSDTANVLWPGERGTLLLHVENKTDTPMDTRASIEVIQFGTSVPAGDVWTPHVFRIARCGSQAVEIHIAPHAARDISVSPAIPERFGGYAVVADLGAHGRAYAASIARVRKPPVGSVQFPTFAMDFTWPDLMNEQVLMLFEKLGIKGARTGGDFVPESAADYSRKSAELATLLDNARKHHITVMLTIGNGSAPMPLGRPRPWLSAGAVMLNTKDDRVWLPSFDAQFEQWTRRVALRFGWPKGPVNAVELWNEPWEGISISGWGADIPRFRELYERMARGVERARKEGGVQVLIGGACSSTNTRDKLFPDGSNKFLKWLDFVSIHYQPLAADPVLVPEWAHRKSPNGPVRVWDTESWIANSEDRVAGVIASMRAQGQDRTAGVYDGNVYESANRKIGERTYPVVQAYPPAAAIAAVQSFIGQRPFRGLLFHNGLPWVFVFGGITSPDDGTAVVVGDLGAIYDRDRTLFRGVKLSPGGHLTLGNSPEFQLFDFYGNRLFPGDSAISIPLNGLGYFIRSNGSKGSFARLLMAMRSARIEGYDPLDIVAHDFTAPLASHPVLRLSVTNILNRRIQAVVHVDIPGIDFQGDEQNATFEPHETRELSFTVKHGESVASNSYPLSVRAATGEQETVSFREDLHVNQIAKRTILVDGNLDDWGGVLPQTVRSKGIRPSLTEKAWLPFQQFGSGVADGLATAYLAYDDSHFYFALKAADSTPDDGMMRFEYRDDDSFFYPDRVWDPDHKELKWPAGVRHFSYRKNFEIPSGNNHDNVQIAFNVLPEDCKPLLPFPPGTERHFAVYADTDYELALNPVASQYGGGTEVWRLLAPGMPRKSFFPRQPKAPSDGGPLKDAKLAIRRDGDLRVVEAAIPWSDLPDVRAALDSHRTIKFTYRVNNNKGPSLELAADRSVSKVNPLTFHDDWTTHWANELEFGFEK